MLRWYNTDDRLTVEMVPKRTGVIEGFDGLTRPKTDSNPDAKG